MRKQGITLALIASLSLTLFANLAFANTELENRAPAGQTVLSPAIQKLLDAEPQWSCLPSGTACRHADRPCCSGECVEVNHGTDYCAYNRGGGGRCLPSGTPCHHSDTPCCTHCVVVNHGTDYCAY